MDKGKIIQVSDRGQITIPSRLREKLSINGAVMCKVINKRIVLEPVGTRDLFLEEIEEAIRDIEKNGGYTLEEVMEESEKLP